MLGLLRAKPNSVQCGKLIHSRCARLEKETPKSINMLAECQGDTAKVVETVRKVI